MESIGQVLRKERELRELSLAELAQTTRIPVRTLERLEADDFDALPGDVFVRGFLRSYARALGIEEDAIVERYGKGRASDAETPAPLPSVAPPERGRRFGIAIALVILLILFTLALSIVLRPRHRDAPIELSALHGLHLPLDRFSPSASGVPGKATCYIEPMCMAFDTRRGEVPLAVGHAYSQGEPAGGGLAG